MALAFWGGLRAVVVERRWWDGARQRILGSHAASDALRTGLGRLLLWDGCLIDNGLEPRVMGDITCEVDPRYIVLYTESTKEVSVS
jgi:hypothetical protein